MPYVFIRWEREGGRRTRVCFLPVSLPRVFKSSNPGRFIAGLRIGTETYEDVSSHNVLAKSFKSRDFFETSQSPSRVLSYPASVGRSDFFLRGRTLYCINGFIIHDFIHSSKMIFIVMR